MLRRFDFYYFWSSHREKAKQKGPSCMRTVGLKIVTLPWLQILYQDKTMSQNLKSVLVRLGNMEMVIDWTRIVLGI